MELLNNIVKKLEERFPKELKEEWDNVGLMIESQNKEISKVMIVLDVTEKVVDEAINKGVDLIISHHPLIFFKDEIRNIRFSNPLGRKIIKLIKNDIAVYSMHTNLDIADGGMNDYTFEKLEVVDVLKNEKEPCLRCGKLKEEMSVIEFTKYLKEKLEIEEVRLVTNDENRVIRNVAVVTGSGGGLVNLVSKLGVDLYITGDLKHSAALNSLELGIDVIDAGHYGTEKIVKDIITRFIVDEKLDLIIIESKAMKNPIKIC